MATHYVNSAAAGANDGTSKTDAWTSLSSATTVAAGDIIWISHTHNQNPGTNGTYNFTNGTQAAPIQIYSVNFGTDVYTPASSAQFSGAASDVIWQGIVAAHGLYFGVADDINLGGGTDWQRFVDCVIDPADDLIINYSDGGVAEFEGCTFDLVAGTNFQVAGSSDGTQMTCKNCTVTGTAPTTASIGGGSDGGSTMYWDCCDLSAVTSLFTTVRAGCLLALTKCNLHASFALPTSIVGNSTLVYVEACDDGTISVPALGVNKWAIVNGVVQSTLSVYRTGGANDGFQANAYSWELASSASASEIFQPLISPPLTVRAAADGSISGATARGIFTSTRVLPLATPAALTTDSGSTWNGSGVGTKQQIDVTLTNGATLTVYVASGGTLNNDDFWIEVSEPDQVGGPVSVRCFLAKPSTTVYVDPFPVISGTTSSKQWFAEGVQFAGGDESPAPGGGTTLFIPVE